jgi:hypothetical protein
MMSSGYNYQAVGWRAWHHHVTMVTLGPVSA